MSLTKLLKAPIKLFKKDVISFLIIRRHDIGLIDNKLHYIAVRPSASISVLRQKLWHLLDLPDFCEEILILKSDENTEIPLTNLRKGSDPQRPFILEVYLPRIRVHSTTVVHKNMLTMGNNEDLNENLTPIESGCDKTNCLCNGNSLTNDLSLNTMSNDTIPLNKLRYSDIKRNVAQSEYKKSELSCRVSSSSIFSKIHGKKSRDNFVNVLLKIQNDLSTLSTKLSNLETRIPV